MLRVTTFRLNGNPPPDATPAVGIQAFSEFVAALNKVRGNNNVRWFFGSGGIVITGEPESYAVADAILADRGVQAAGAKVFSFGYVIAEDLFLLEVGKVTPFVAPS